MTTANPMLTTLATAVNRVANPAPSNQVKLPELATASARILNPFAVIVSAQEVVDRCEEMSVAYLLAMKWEFEYPPKMHMGEIEYPNGLQDGVLRSTMAGFRPHIVMLFDNDHCICVMGDVRNLHALGFSLERHTT